MQAGRPRIVTLEGQEGSKLPRGLSLGLEFTESRPHGRSISKSIGLQHDRAIRGGRLGRSRVDCRPQFED